MNRRQFVKGVGAVGVMAAVPVALASDNVWFPRGAFYATSGFAQCGDFERWKLTNAGTGELQYIGEEPFEGRIEVTLSGFDNPDYNGTFHVPQGKPLDLPRGEPGSSIRLVGGSGPPNIVYSGGSNTVVSEAKVTVS